MYLAPTVRSANETMSSPLGNASVTQPSGGFSQTALADVFNFKRSVPSSSTATPTPSPIASDITLPPKSKSTHPNPHTAPIIGGLVGGVALITLATSVSFYYRQNIHRFVTGGESPFQEMDSQRTVKEIMDTDVCWELPAEVKPVELWSPTDRQDRGSPCVSEKHLKYAGEFF